MQERFTPYGSDADCSSFVLRPKPLVDLRAAGYDVGREV